MSEVARAVLMIASFASYAPLRLGVAVQTVLFACQWGTEDEMLKSGASIIEVLGYRVSVCNPLKCSRATASA